MEEAVGKLDVSPMEILPPSLTAEEKEDTLESLELSKKFSKIDVDAMIIHVFFPRKLPQSESARILADEANLMTLMNKTVSFLHKNFPSIIPDSTERMWQTWNSVQSDGPLDENIIYKAIHSLEYGDMLPLYIRQQNCGFILSMPRINEEEVAIVSTFNASLPNDTVTLTPTDIKMEFPSQSVKVPISALLASSALAQHLAILHTYDFETSMAHAKKRGHSLPDYRNVADTILVSKWLTTSLTNKDSSLATPKEFPKISKKIRDQILIEKDKVKPFRRSGLWMTIKAVLQLSFTRELETDEGTFVYKLVLLHLMGSLCKFLLGHPLDIDLANQMIAKLARRIEKLDTYANLCKNHILEEACNSVRRNSTKVIHDIKIKMNADFRKLCDLDWRAGQRVPLTDLNFERDIKHKIPNLLIYINSKINPNRYFINGNRYIFKSRNFQRHFNNNSSFPSAHNISSVTDDIELGFLLADWENWILEYLNPDDFDPTIIRDLAFFYIEKSKEYYKNDPLGASRMILTALQIVKILDTIAVNAHPMFKEHRSGIETRIIKQLLLPKGKQLRNSALPLEQYFDSRNKNATFPSLIGENDITINSFSARFGAENEEMCRLRTEILAEGERKAEEKRNELSRLRERLAILKKQLEGLECHYGTRTNKWGREYRYKIKPCSKCNTETAICQLTINVYEKPLRDEIEFQNAVVFELRIPVEIACLRDVLHTFNREFCQSSASNIYIADGSWVDSEQLRWRVSGNHQQRVHLGSSSRSFYKSHLKSKHVSSIDSEIIVTNGCQCSFYGKTTSGKVKITKTERDDVKKFCTLKVNQGSVYSQLQWALTGTQHSQNKIIADQSYCPRTLALSEWIEFGSLRAGHRLQMRNIYRAIEFSTLSFKNESVVSLLMQALWEAGPNKNLGLWYRESHEDLVDIPFTLELGEALGKFLSSQRNNWKQPYNLLTVVLITTRVLEMNSNSNVEEVFVKLLMEYRAVALEWMQNIEEVIKTFSDTQKNEKLRNTLVKVAICCALTFSVDPSSQCFDKLLDSSSVQIWLTCIVKIHNNKILGENNLSNSSNDSGSYSFRMAGLTNMNDDSSFEQNLLRIVRNTGIEMQNQINALMAANNFMALNIFMTNNWTCNTWNNNNSDNESWTMNGAVFYKHTKDTSTQVVRCVQIDVILGHFLVDGCPASRLTPEIVAHPLFERVFGKTVFDVFPDGGNIFTTLYPYGNCKYSFELSSAKGLQITERDSEGNKYELLPPNVFENQVPYPLVHEYCHWWNRGENIIEFRPLPFVLRGNSCENKTCHYILDLNSKLLIQKESKRFLVDVKSDSWSKIVNYFDRFEKQEHIKITCNSNHNAIVELSRMRLHFIVNAANELESREYEGMRVSVDHKPRDTLLGLYNGLLLQDASGKQKSYLVPYGKIEISKFGGAHQNARINLEELRQPPFFIYEVDDRMWQLKAGKNYCSSFYLAYLHAITAHPLPDKFTGMTGTEEALQLLMSARCWSPEPFDVESTNIMENISKLSPVRKRYNRVPGLLTENWPAFLPSAAAHEMYTCIIEKLRSDSHRLGFLFKLEPNLQNNVSISNKKFYDRHICYNPNAKITQQFYDVFGGVIPEINRNQSIYQKTISSDIISSIRKLSHLEFVNSCWFPEEPEKILVDFLIKGSTLNGVSDEEFSKCRIDEWGLLDLRESFIDLYNFARQVDENKLRPEWTLFLCFMAFSGSSMDILSILQTVSRYSNAFADENPPCIASYQNPNEITLNRSQLESIVKSSGMREEEYLSSFGWKHIGFSYFPSNSEEYKKNLETRKTLLDNYEATMVLECDAVLESIQQQWTARRDYMDTSALAFSFKLINVTGSKLQIDPLLQKWNSNRKLHEFLKAVSAKCKSLPPYCNFTLTDLCAGTFCAKGETTAKVRTNFDDMFLKYFTLLKTNPEADEIFRKGNLECPFLANSDIINETKIDNLKARQTYLQQKCDEFWKYLSHANEYGANSHLVDSGLFPRIVPSLMLQKLIFGRQGKNQGFTQEKIVLKNLIGAWGVSLTLEAQTSRVIKYMGNKNQAHALQRELDTIPHVNWSPKEKPLWLLFEIEMNLMIRGIQVDVAERMINPPGEKHSVMQLNMGEGKTAVIVPLLCLSLADGKNYLCRVTVLKSLFRTNLASLRQCIGGLTDRRVYIFPCRRDMGIGEIEAHKILEVYQECQRERGVVMTLPEYTLSFQLKMYDMAHKMGDRSCTGLVRTYQWLNYNTRDVLDESDEILHAKYQLIYTVGSKVTPDGGTKRWTVAQELLKIVPRKMKILHEKFGVETVEWNVEMDEKDRKEIFNPCRILQEAIYGDLIDALAEDFLSGKTGIEFPDLKKEDQQYVKDFLTIQKVEQSTHTKVMSIFKEDTEMLDTILILAAYLKYDVLKVALSKRWRVNYGVNPAGKLKMAVPFKAKDVAAENTEFGHPDIAICLTLLSYYYSGLTDVQLIECFEVLENLSNAAKIYEGWIEKVSEVDPSVEKYESTEGILEDTQKRDKLLFPVLTQNMYVIDFWLCETVFKREARQFEGKMMTSAWDLCPDDRKNKVTGFSGTNDTKYLLPATTQQNDLPKLEKTNENVREMLLKPENENYHELAANVNDKMILEELVDHGIPVLVDSGALMLELSNEQVAEQWLKLLRTKNKTDEDKMSISEQVMDIESECKGEVDAAVYFNDDNILMVKDYENRNTQFEFSPFRDRLDRCVVYLDDAHTRGTDLKFPGGTRACVTLGGKITRDKTVQACMRMRMLGNGHSVSFWASQEAHNSIRELSIIEGPIKTENVLQWIKYNSDKFEKEGLVPWAAAGINFAQKRAAFHLWAKEDIHKMSKDCCDNETIELQKTYGELKQEKLFTEIVENHFQRLLTANSTLEILRALPFAVMNEGTKNIIKTRDEVLDRLKPIGELKRFAQLLDEEQEKELEQEKEVNVEVCKQLERKSPESSKLDKNVETFLRTGYNSWEKDAKKFHTFFQNSLVELPTALRTYALKDMIDPTWGQTVFATKDFLSVVQKASIRYVGFGRLLPKRHPQENKTEYEADDPEFLRPVAWIACCQSRILILLSPFEANAYFPLFRSKYAISTLRMYSPRLKPKQNCLVNVERLSIPYVMPATPINDYLLAQLSLFSGSLYFRSVEEQEKYCHFIGFVPRPRSPEQDTNFERGYILNGGFVLPEYRQRVSGIIKEKCKFAKNPEKLIRRIAEGRHGTFPRSSHVSMLVVESKSMLYTNESVMQQGAAGRRATKRTLQSDGTEKENTEPQRRPRIIWRLCNHKEF